MPIHCPPLANMVGYLMVDKKVPLAYYSGSVGRYANTVFYIGKRYRLPPREGEITCGGETVNRAKARDGSPHFRIQYKAGNGFITQCSCLPMPPRDESMDGGRSNAWDVGSECVEPPASRPYRASMPVMRKQVATADNVKRYRLIP